MMEIARLKLKLWWHFKPFWYHCDYRVVVRRKKWLGPYGRHWSYVNLLARKTVAVDGSLYILPAMALPIGPVQQWTPEEAVGIALEQHEARMQTPAWHGLLDDASQRPPSLEAPIVQRLSYVLLPAGNYRIQCGACAWTGRPTEPDHLCLPQNCSSCADVHREFEEHAAQCDLTPPETAMVDRGEPDAR